jgi:hypothetical protein
MSMSILCVMFSGKKNVIIQLDEFTQCYGECDHPAADNINVII